MKKKRQSDVAVIEAPVDIRAKMNTTLEELGKAIEDTAKRRDIQQQAFERWTARQERAQNIVAQTPEEGRAAAEMLLQQANEYAEVHEKAAADETEHLNLLREQHRSLEESVTRFDAFNRVQMLQERIKSINSSRPEAITSGGEAKTTFDQREIEGNIHMINALIELRKES